MKEGNISLPRICHIIFFLFTANTNKLWKALHVFVHFTLLSTVDYWKWRTRAWLERLIMHWFNTLVLFFMNVLSTQTEQTMNSQQGRQNWILLFCHKEAKGQRKRAKLRWLIWEKILGDPGFLFLYVLGNGFLGMLSWILPMIFTCMSGEYSYWFGCLTTYSGCSWHARTFVSSMATAGARLVFQSS